MNLPKLGDVMICINAPLTGFYGLDDSGSMDLFNGDIATVLNCTYEDKYDVMLLLVPAGICIVYFLHRYEYTILSRYES